MLFFLSKGFFYSANCKREVAATLANGNPVMLLHETDPNRGGTSMEQMLADCSDDWREEIFVPRRPVIPWLHVKEFKIVSLKMIVSSMLLHQSKMERRLQAMDEDLSTMPVHRSSAGKAPDLHTLGADLYVSGEVTRQQLSFPPFVLITSTENPGILGLRKVARPRKSILAARSSLTLSLRL